ncbi:MAG TPA: hypothetical protein VFC09_16490 [Candidatus Dormibacteraeota bacterium]|nr:hypothetical protein [Candidatus Dormibacteraeota bacterium]
MGPSRQSSAPAAASPRHAPAGVAAGAILLALAVTGCSSSTTTPPAATASATTSHTSTSTSTASALPAAGTVAATIPSIGALTSKDDNYGIAADGTSVWIYNGDTGMVTRVTEATGAVAATIPLHPGCSTGRGCGNLAVGDGGVWVANDADGTITHIDPASNRAVATISVGATAAPQVYTTPGVVWSANYFADSYTQIDPHTNAITGTLSHHLSAESVTLAAGSIWLCDAGGAPAVTRLDPSSGAVQSHFDFSTGSSIFCLDAAPLGSSLYVVTEGDTAKVIDAATGSTHDAPAAPGKAHVERGLVGGANGTWLIDADFGLFRLDPTTGGAVAQLPLTGAAGIADDGHSIWVISNDGSLSRITPAA